MNQLYNQMNRNDPLSMLDEIKSNPTQFLAQRNVRVPQHLKTSDEILNYLMSNGKLKQNTYNQAYNAAMMLMNR